jgi:hypothetical protein
MDNKSRTLPAPCGPKCVVSVVKARLWGFVSTPDLSIKCEDSASRYPWKIEIVSTVFWVGETGERRE